jgi:hypothetical protein
MTAPDLPGPVAVLAHNLFLCKNAALVSAFANVVRKLGKDTRYRFFSVVHDLAEQGRVERLQAIAGMERMGVHLHAEMAVTGGAVRVVAVNRQQVARLKQAGIPAHFLCNPVIAQKRPMNRDRKNEPFDRLLEHCRKRRIMFDPDRPVYCYPSRTIARKNPVEAIAVACLLLEGNLLLGLSGSSEKDRLIHAAIKNMIADYSLPVVTGIQAVFRKRKGDTDPVADIYGLADTALSTSVSESFGYLLYEPFLYGRPVVGRKPVGFSYPARVRNPCLYSRLPVPSEWISPGLVLQQYRSVSRMCFGNTAARSLFDRRVVAEVSGSTVDFALLSDEMQINLLRRLLVSSKMKSRWIALLEKSREGWPGLKQLRIGCSGRIVDRNRRIIAVEFSMQRFQKEFRRCFSVVPKLDSRSINRDLLQEKFTDPRIFRMR